MRLDKYLAGKGFSSRTRAARAVERGLVLVNGKRAKVSLEISATDVVEILPEEVSFVSEGGFKLYKALLDFSEKVEGLVFADLGASTGGFTDCLLHALEDTARLLPFLFLTYLVMEYLEQRAGERSAQAVRLLNGAAEARGISLKLNKKPKN